MKKPNFKRITKITGYLLFICLFLPVLIFNGSADGFKLNSVLTEASREYSIPGMTAAIVIDGEITETAAAGVRKFGELSSVQVSDAFMLCSITKPVTATLVNILSEKKILSLNTRIIDVFPEFAGIMQAEYRDVTIKMLLSHRSGMPYMPLTEGGDEFLSISSDMMKRRYQYVKAALIDKPECKPGEKFIYGGGTIIAAAMMEKKTGKRWEELVSEYVFKPLNINSAGFGPMSETDKITGVWEHSYQNGKITVEPWPAGYKEEVHAPAGRNVHISAPDLAQFMISSFPYCSKGRKLISPDVLIDMQQLLYDGPTTAGWFSSLEQWSDWKTVWHSGNNGKSSCVLVFSQKYNSGYVIMANISSQKASEGFGIIEDKLKSYLSSMISSRRIVSRLPIADKSLTKGKPVKASDIYYNSKEYSPEACLDGILDTRWATNDNTKDAWIEVDLQNTVSIKTFFIREEFFPRVESYEISARNGINEEFKIIVSGKKLGDGVFINVPEFKVRYIKLTVHTGNNSGPTISEFHAFF